MGWELVKDTEKVKCWLDLDEIEIYTEGRYRGRNWQNSIGKKIGTKYQWCHDEIEEKWFIITNYIIENKRRYLILVDKDENKFKIKVDSLRHGSLGKLFNKVTINFKYDIGDEINNLKIIDKEYRKDETGRIDKWYKYQCLKCDNIDWKIERSLKNNGCNLCCPSPQKVLKGVNDIATTNPEFIKYFVNQDDIYTYTVSSGKKVLMHCPNCGYQKEMSPNRLTRFGFACPNCSDGISYPEKFITNILTQLNIKFITQLNHTTFNWCQNFKYDFYLTNYNTIIETHGLQHYRNNTGVFKTYEDEHENDLLKYDIAVLNGFEANKNYFVVDSRKSTLEWMKEHIVEKLGYLFDLSNIDWEKADLESQKSHMILACKFKRENQKLFTPEIIKLISEETGVKYSNSTIINWLKRGHKLGLCYYNPKEENLRAKIGRHHTEEARKKISKNNAKARKVVQIDIATKNIVNKFNTKRQAEESVEIKRMDYYLKGKAKTGHEYNGFLWYYADTWEQLNK